MIRADMCIVAAADDKVHLRVKRDNQVLSYN